MNPGQFERARELFEAAIERPRAERDDYIKDRCGDDADLRRHVERLLRQHDHASLPLDMSPLEAPFHAAMDSGHAGVTGLSIGPFRVIRLIGRGGMGEVYEVEQQHPQRRVALKLLRAGLRSPESLRRFELEARVLGRLQHPGIACIHEAGMRHIAGADQPYFVMELVRGRSLDEHAAASPTDARGILDLFVKVCDAVEHAHRMGVVHRDLKPSNILVDESGNPKVVDFGVARLVDPSETARSMHTAEGQLVGTLAYMSPEQVSGTAHEVTSRSDVYSLGVVLFELLTGRLPHDVRGRSLPDAARMIHEEDPSGLGTVNPVFRGDLDTIVVKALDKDTTRRYGSAGELGADIRRFLNDEPVLARPRTATYQLRKFARRHREFVIGLIMTFAALIAGLIAVSWFAVGEFRQRQLAEKIAAQARWESYRNCIAAADRSLRLADVPRAIRTLDSAPEQLRGWEWRYLRRLADMSALTIRASTAPVRAATLAHGAVWTGDDEGTLARWDAADGRPLSSVLAHEAGVSVIALSPDGSRCVTCSPAGELACWSTSDATLLWRFAGTRPIHEQAFFPDGSRLAVPLPRRVAFIDAATGQESGSFALPVDQGGEPAVDSSGRLLLCMLGPVVVCFEMTTQRELWRREAYAAHFSADGSRAWVFSGLAQGIQVIDARSGQLVSDFTSAVPLRFGSSGPWVPSLTGTSTISMLDPDTGATSLTLQGHQDDVLWAWVVPELDKVVTSDAGGVTKLWETHRCIAAFEIPPSNDTVLSGAMLPGGRRAVTVGWGSVKLWDLGSGAELWTRFPLRRELHTVAASPDGSLIAVAGHDRMIAVVSADDGRTVVTTPAFDSYVRQVRWSGTTTFLALTDDGTWHEVAADTGTFIRTGPIDGPTIRTMALAPDGQHWALGDDRGNVWLGPLDSPAQLDAGNSIAPTTSMTFDSTGTRLAAGYHDGSVRLWDPQSARLLWRAASQGTGAARDVAFSPDGSRIVAGLSDGRVLVMDTATGDSLIELNTGASAACSVAFTSDGASIVAVYGAPGRSTVFEATPLIDDLADRVIQSQARALVDDLTDRLHFAQEVAAAAGSAPDTAPRVAQAAARLAAARGDNANKLNSDAWTIARFPGRSPEDYTLAVAKARRACAIRPGDHALLNTLGVALLRAGLHTESIAVLKQCIAMPRPPGQPAHPVDLLALAIAEAQSGDLDAARATLASAHASLGSGRFPSDPEIDWLLSEATGVLSTRLPEPGSGAPAPVD